MWGEHHLPVRRTYEPQLPRCLSTRAELHLDHWRTWRCPFTSLFRCLVYGKQRLFNGNMLYLFSTQLTFLPFKSMPCSSIIIDSWSWKRLEWSYTVCLIYWSKLQAKPRKKRTFARMCLCMPRTFLFVIVYVIGNAKMVVILLNNSRYAESQNTIAEMHMFGNSELLKNPAYAIKHATIIRCDFK